MSEGKLGAGSRRMSNLKQISGFEIPAASFRELDQSQHLGPSPVSMFSENVLLSGQRQCQPP